MTTIDSIYNVFGITAPFEKIGKLLFSETYLKMECWDGKESLEEIARSWQK